MRRLCLRGYGCEGWLVQWMSPDGRSRKHTQEGTDARAGPKDEPSSLSQRNKQEQKVE